MVTYCISSILLVEAWRLLTGIPEDSRMCFVTGIIDDKNEIKYPVKIIKPKERRKSCKAIDMGNGFRIMRYLDRYGHQNGIFVNSGYIKFFWVDNEYDVKIFGDGVEKIGENGFEIDGKYLKR